MNPEELESRISNLESQVKRLFEMIDANHHPEKNWRRNVGLFGDDPLMREIDDLGQKIRKSDRF